MYTEELANSSVEEIERNTLNISVGSWIPLNKLMEKEDRVKCLKGFERMAFSGYAVFSNLRRLFRYNSFPLDSDEDCEPTNLEAIQNLEKTLKGLQIDEHTFALESETAADVFFYKNIALPREFRFLGEGSDRSNLKSILAYDVYLPFNNKNHEDGKCAVIDYLPLFYKKKGR